MFVRRIRLLITIDEGFTLFETLIATMIFAVALVVIMQLFSGALRANRVSDQYTRAVFHAREQMEIILLNGNLEKQGLTGAWDDGFSWSAEINEIDPMSGNMTETSEASGNKKNTKPPMPYLLEMKVGWQDGSKVREVTLFTVILGGSDAKKKE